MMRKTARYLLTHHPLLWNMQLGWMLPLHLLLHLLFFIAGYWAVNANSIGNYYSVWRVGGAGLMTFSVLCSLLVVIVWLVLYLRHNAFKNFYRISHRYGAKEFLLLFLLLLPAITYFVSFQSGVKARGRTIANRQELVAEVNTINEAMAFLPLSNIPYFVLNRCESKERRTPPYRDIGNFDTTLNYGDPAINRQIREALRRPDAFSYRHYCEPQLVISTDTGIATARHINQRINHWLNRGDSAAIKALLRRFIALCRKYDLDYRLDADTLVAQVFSQPLFNRIVIVPEAKEEYVNGRIVKINPYYLQRSKLFEAIHFLDDCQWSRKNFAEERNLWMICGYIALTLSILLFCFRRFSKKTFLIAMVGILVWAILIGLLLSGARGSQPFFALLVLLAVSFLVLALYLLRNQRAKWAAGALLTWHALLAPFIVMCITGLATAYLNRIANVGLTPEERSRYLQQHYSLLYWIDNHVTDIFLVNLFCALLYMAFVFHRWTQRWHTAPEE